ncbi:hypothetical protein [Rhizobium sp. FY34]|uniref:hypothetical protein n=1 Tax=Rhizobium sp. FY34 TaxID=2562309 RepID=UPI0010BF93F2|nr:hypothetical protein [Rhizobium sp. FY34]
MKQFLAKAVLAALITVSGFAAPFSAASAAGSDVQILVQYPGQDRGYDRPRHRPDAPARPDICSPRLAEDKAARMGIRRARVVDVNRRVVVVAGFDRGGRDRAVFANLRGCPLIRR